MARAPSVAVNKVPPPAPVDDTKTERSLAPIPVQKPEGESATEEAPSEAPEQSEEKESSDSAALDALNAVLPSSVNQADVGVEFPSEQGFESTLDVTADQLADALDKHRTDDEKPSGPIVEMPAGLLGVPKAGEKPEVDQGEAPSAKDDDSGEERE